MIVECPRCTAQFETGPTEKRIDVGCGGTMRRAAPGFDVYTDVIDPGKVKVPGEYVQCPMEKMPFAGKEFSFARCHHVIEHTDDPGLACKELIRIARGGVINFPPMQAEIMFGRKDHKWFVVVDKGRLLFIKKRHPSYGVARAVTGCELDVAFRWQTTFYWQVVE